MSLRLTALLLALAASVIMWVGIVSFCLWAYGYFSPASGVQLADTARPPPL